MATCACGVPLSGRSKKCDGCKDTGRTGASTRKPRVGAKPTRKPPAKKAPAKKTAAKKTAPKPKVVYPAGLGARGRQMWKALGYDLDTPGGLLALEACRCSDRLERLDSLLAGGESWFELVEKDEGSGRMVVVLNAPLAEARQHQTTLKGLLNELGATRVKGNPGYGGDQGKPTGPKPQPPTEQQPAVTPLDAARQKRREREQAT